jgi:hypothetical protein
MQRIGVAAALGALVCLAVAAQEKVKVKLLPGTTYTVGVNSYRHTGFQDPDGQPAVPYTWVFKTKTP